jgi:heat shock protein HslJ
MEVAIALDDEGAVAGSTGCRRFEGEYTTEADRLVIAPVVLLGLPCEGEARHQDRRIVDLLDAVVGWRRVGDVLTLRDGSGAVLIEAVARPAPDA